MADSDYYLIKESTLTSIGDAIRTKTGGTELIPPENMPDEILNNISTDILEIDTPAEMDSLLIADNIGKTYRYIGETTSDYTNGDLYMVEEIV